MRITIQHILELIDVLPKGEPFDYVKPGDNKVVLVNVDFVNREISAKRISSNGDEQYVKFIEPNLKLIESGIEDNKPFSMDKLFNNGGNARSVIEAILARTPEFHACWIDRHKHLVWIPTMTHAAGALSVINAQDIPSQTQTPIKNTIQKIYFGTPGCGKSHTVSEYINNNPGIEIRTTFHPDTDYSSFVGAYKPKKKNGDLTYEFVPQAFTKAYCKAWKNPDVPVYLIIEEINRGNCAQIFGDLFQLLDRSDGYSEYPIDADTDITEYLEKELFRLDDGEVSGNEGIENGKLCLPKNLHILATMNTSDQSLFPMDSAFKRRWEWEYVPVDPANPKSQFVITIGDKRYKWASFLVKVNERIHKLSDSEDKQMGNFFIKSDIGVEEFKSKVMFYLWSEVCKEYEKCGSFFKDKGDNEAEFTFNSLYPTNEASNKRLQGFMEYLGVEEA